MNNQDQGLTFVHEIGMIPAITETLTELERLLNEIIKKVDAIETTRELTEEEKAEIWAEFQCHLYERFLCRAAMAKAKDFESLTVLDCGTFQ
jgi:hypothetical protein